MPVAIRSICGPRSYPGMAAMCGAVIHDPRCPVLIRTGFTSRVCLPRNFAAAMIMRLLLLLIILGQAGAAWCQPVSDHAAIGITDAQGRKQGAWVRHWPRTAQVKYKGAFKNDRPVGEFVHYDEEGRITSTLWYADDGRSSRAEHFHPNGKRMAMGRYVDQKKDSVWNYYDEHGRLRRTEGYSEGELHGARISYFEDGSRASEEHFRHGRSHGPQKAWYMGGNPRSEALHQEGVADGRSTFWYPNGTKEIEGDLRDGMRDGTWYYYNPDGSMRMQVVYKGGEWMKEKRENGTFTSYHDEDRVKSEVTYVKGSRQGPFVEYHDNGSWVMEVVPADEVKGIPAFEQQVLKGQTIKREGRYKDDKLDGEVKEYDEQGRLIKKEQYVAGVLQ